MEQNYTAAPAPKEKKNLLPWIICVILLIALGGVIAWKFLDNGGGTKCETAAGGQKSSGGSKTETSDEKYATIYKTLNLVKEIKTISLKYAENDYAYSDSGYNLGYKISDKYSTNLDWNYGFSIGATNASNLDEWNKFQSKVTANSGFQSDVKAKMKEYGLSETTIEDGMMGGDEDIAYESDDGYFCKVSKSGTLYVGCGHTGWISDEKIALVEKLGDAFVSENGGTQEKPLYVNASVLDIKTSKSGNYQTLTGSISNGAGVFYRKGTDGEWKYFTGGHVGPSCDMFNTDELKEAFEGYTCWIQGSDSLSTVKR